MAEEHAFGVDVGVDDVHVVVLRRVDGGPWHLEQVDGQRTDDGFGQALTALPQVGAAPAWLPPPADDRPMHEVAAEWLEKYAARETPWRLTEDQQQRMVETFGRLLREGTLTCRSTA